MTFEVSTDRLTIDGKTLTPPNTIEDSVVRDESVVVVVGTSRSGGYENPDFEVPVDDRNVLAFDRTARIQWVIDSIGASDDESYHYEVWKVGEWYLTRHTTGTVQFEPDTGEILEVLRDTQLPIGDAIVGLSGEVHDVVEFDDAVFVVCSRSTYDLYAFNADGTERWRSDAGERRGSIFVEDGQLWEQTAVNRTTDHRYRLDPETGERFDREVVDTGLW